MTCPSLRRLKPRLAKLPERERQVIAAYCLVYDASEGASDAFRRLALAGITVLLDEMRGKNDYLK